MTSVEVVLVQEVINRVLLYRGAGMKSDQHVGFLTDPTQSMSPGPQTDNTKLAIKAAHLNALVDEVQQLRRKADDLRSRNEVLTTIAVRAEQVRELHRPVRVYAERQVDAGTEQVTLFSICRECHQGLVDSLYDGRIPDKGIPLEEHYPCQTIKILEDET